MKDKIICGLKLTHDGSIAVIRGNDLLFSIEMEKINNNPRFSPIPDLSVIDGILAGYGIQLSDVDHFVVDGWAGLDESWIDTSFDSHSLKLQLACYREKSLTQNVMQSYEFEQLTLSSKFSTNYSSYMHVTGHIASAYCSSPFAKENKSSYILVWDGGMFPRLYYFDTESITIKNLGPINFIIGNFYQVFASYFYPFNKANPNHKEDLSIAGKVMAYIANGEVLQSLLDEFNYILENHLSLSMDYVHVFVQYFKGRNPFGKYRDEDVLATMHKFLEDQLILGLGKKIKKFKFGEKNLCYSGGCALNIKWNSTVRYSGLFDRIWVPPFPNDSGSAIGSACAKMIEVSPNKWLNWSVFSGPEVSFERVNNSKWSTISCSIKQLANILVRNNLPIVLLHGNAELGPRSLGGRSIIAPASDTTIKETLNRIKDRESYRPVAPICLEEDAPTVFSPGTPDPYMLFDHMVKDNWVDRIPAICHLDGSARLQTVNAIDNPIVHELLSEYKKHTGIPVLCNTSANFNGKGFFPDVKSVMDWGKVDLVWSNGNLYMKKESKFFKSNEKIEFDKKY